VNISPVCLIKCWEGEICCENTILFVRKLFPFLTLEKLDNGRHVLYLIIMHDTYELQSATTFVKGLLSWKVEKRFVIVVNGIEDDES